MDAGRAHWNDASFLGSAIKIGCLALGAHLAGISGGENIYLGSRIIIHKLSRPFRSHWGADGMDAGRAVMTLPFWEVPSKLMLGLWDAAGLNGSVFHRKKRDNITSSLMFNYN